MLDQKEHILTRRIKDGEEAAFKEMYLTFFNAVAYFISKYIDNPDTIKDLTQEAFFLLWKHRSRLNESIGFKSYLLSIAKNLVHNHIRSSNYNRKYIEAAIKKSSESISSNELEISTMHAIEQKNLLDLIHEEINKLPEKQREVFLMSRMQFKSNKEIAEALNISVKTVEYRIMRALMKIRKIVDSSVRGIIL